MTSAVDIDRTVARPDAVPDALPAVPGTDRRIDLTFAVLTAAGVTFALCQSLVAPALPVIQQSLGTSQTAVAWVMTAYLLSASVFTPVIGRLGDLHGKERVLVASLVIFAGGTVVSALAPTIEVLILGRVLQGAGGAIFPLAFGIIRDEFPRERVPGAIALISAIMGIGGGLGILLAGPIVDVLSWHWLFWLPLVVIAAVTVLTVLYVPSSPVRAQGTVSWRGAVLLSAWLVALLVALSEGNRWGWTSPATLGLLTLAAVLLVVWLQAEGRTDHPLVDPRMLRRRAVWTVNASAFLIGAGLFSSFLLIPMFVESAPEAGYGFGASITQAGLFLLPSTAGMLLASPIASRLGIPVGSRATLVIGSVFSAVAFGGLAVLHTAPWHVYLASLLMGVGIGLSFSALANLIVASVRPDQTGVATGMNTVMRTIGGSVGSQVGAALLAATVVAGAAPTESGFTTAFGLAGVLCALAAVTALAVPKPHHGL